MTQIYAASPQQTAATIQALNDALRCNGIGGITQLSRGVRALGAHQQHGVLAAVAQFTAFTPDNDPHAEHDCAIVEVGAVKVLWKIDYYDLSLRGASDDPSDPAITKRVITIMLAEEY